MQKYKESLKNTPGPVRLQDLPPMVIDYRGLLEYAKKKGVHPGMLSEKEKMSFILKENTPQAI
ncbi:MAG: hypothetical protein J6U01_12795 [Clostridia bacterium]|nr:hypothetical protein [Clostridia bacterium]